MSGSDTGRGINFQYACAIESILEFIANPTWDMIQLEGDADVEDVLVFDRARHVIIRTQIKQKNDLYQWQPAEFAGVVQAFAGCSNFEETYDQFVYSEFEGPTFVCDIKPIFVQIQPEEVRKCFYRAKRKSLKSTLHWTQLLSSLKLDIALNLSSYDTCENLKGRIVMYKWVLCVINLYEFIINLNKNYKRYNE